jgi:hypothetical protein
MRRYIDTDNQAVLQRIAPVVNRAFLQQHIGTLQLFLLTAFFAMPLLLGVHFPFLPRDNLAEILTVETGVLIYGFYLTGFVYLPIAMSDSVWVRRACLFFAFLIAIPLTSGYRHDYGFYGLLGFCLLLFANYSAVFIASISFEERTKLTAEAGLRCIVYVIIFSAAAVFSDGLADRSSLGGNEALMTGSIYFGSLTLLESKRYFSKAINLILHMVNNTFVRPPTSKVCYVNGRIRAYVVSKNNVHRGGMLFLTGSACTLFSLVFLYGTSKVDSWFVIAAIWVICGPALIFGVLFIFGGITNLFTTWKKGPALLQLQEQALKTDNKLYAMGIIPGYSRREKRSDLAIHLVHYKVNSIAGEEFVVRVKELFNEKVGDRYLRYQTTDHGTKFKVEYSLPAPGNSKQGRGGYEVWHLQVSMNETVEIKGRAGHSYSWQVVFPLPGDLIMAAE